MQSITRWHQRRRGFDRYQNIATCQYLVYESNLLIEYEEYEKSSEDLQRRIDKEIELHRLEQEPPAGLELSSTQKRKSKKPKEVEAGPAEPEVSSIPKRKREGQLSKPSKKPKEVEAGPAEPDVVFLREIPAKQVEEKENDSDSSTDSELPTFFPEWNLD